MYPMTKTDTERFAEQLQPTAPDIKLMQKLIKEHNTSKMHEGIRYYENDNDIMERVQYAVIDGYKVIDRDKPNNKIPHGWHKLLVDQKVAYLVGNPINFSTEDEELLEHINYSLGEKFDDVANELVKNASNKGKEWLHPYIDEEGEFDFVIVPAEQIIPIYEDKRQTKIQHIIRHYPIVLADRDVLQVELWSGNDVTYYILEDNALKMDNSELINPASHFYYVNNQEERGYGWERVPFIPFRNNEQEQGDLHYYKQLIDAYDNKISDNQNSFEEIQELIYILKDYEGQSLSEFMTNLKHYKAINVSGDGGVDTLQAEIPMTSIDSHLDRLKESIFTFGGGVNATADDMGSAPSGIALKFLYSLLDMKADTLERKFRTSLQDLIWFLCEYLDMQGDAHEKHDYKAVTFTFTRSTMQNDAEMAEIASKSKGIISDRTLIANHPFVDNLQDEMEQMELERKEREATIDLDQLPIEPEENDDDTDDDLDE